jgi:hypothetical protein
MLQALLRRRAVGNPGPRRHDDWLIVREHDPAGNDIIRVRCIGIDPFA